MKNQYTSLVLGASSLESSLIACTFFNGYPLSHLIWVVWDDEFYKSICFSLVFVVAIEKKRVISYFIDIFSAWSISFFLWAGLRTKSLLLNHVFLLRSFLVTELARCNADPFLIWTLLAKVCWAEYDAKRSDSEVPRFVATTRKPTRCFAQGQVGGVMQQLQHLTWVMAFVSMGA